MPKRAPDSNKQKFRLSVLEVRGKVLSHKKPEYQSAKLAKEGLDKIFNMVSKKLNENRMPRTPEEKIALAEQMEREEQIYRESKKAEQRILDIRRERKNRAEFAKLMKQDARLYRREKIKEKVGSIWGVIKDVHK